MTRFAPAVLVCIMALAVISGVGFALSQTLAQRLDEPYGDNTTINNVWKDWSQKSRLQGDPIGDPVPNKVKR